MKHPISNIALKTSVAAIALTFSSLSFAQRTAPQDDNISKTRPILLVHGFEAGRNPSTDCASKFANVIKAIKEQGFTGEIKTITYYENSSNCDVNLAELDNDIHRESTWKEIGAALSRYVYNNYSINGQTVDILGHSMGGLIVRAAVQGGSEQAEGFQAIMVEDAVALATPHTGVGIADACTDPQCNALGKSHPDFEWLATNGNPQGMTGTDWSTQGSSADIMTHAEGAMAMDLDDSHKKLYGWLSHNWQLINRNSVNHAVMSMCTDKQ